MLLINLHRELQKFLILYIHFCPPYWHQPLPTNLKNLSYIWCSCQKKRLQESLSFQSILSVSLHVILEIPASFHPSRSSSSVGAAQHVARNVCYLENSIRFHEELPSPTVLELKMMANLSEESLVVLKPMKNCPASATRVFAAYACVTFKWAM